VVGERPQELWRGGAFEDVEGPSGFEVRGADGEPFVEVNARRGECGGELHDELLDGGDVRVPVHLAIPVARERCGQDLRGTGDLGTG
jgi:hypothetical protein